MGLVYACRHRELAGHIVAMKVLFSEVASDEVAAARFRNEIVASYGVSHPNVVRAYEYFKDGDLIAFTMEYIGGGDLADRISEDDALEIDEIVTMLCQIAAGVQAIHEAGIIHRDLKPENILLTGQGEIKITDFGIARTNAGPRLTEHGGVVGTIDYVSPEYLDQGQVDRRSDIYALGVIAYEMVTGVAPFEGKSVVETMTLRLRTDPKPPHQIRLDCPIELSSIILRALAREPSERYQQADEMLSDLQAFIGGDEIDVATSSSVNKVIKPKDEEGQFSASDALASETPSLAASTVGASLGESPIGIPSVTAAAPKLADDNVVEPVVGDVAQQSGSSFRQVAERALGASSDSGVRPSFAEPNVSSSNVRHGVSGSGISAAPLFPQSESSFGDRLSPSVAVSQSGLSIARVQELSEDIYEAQGNIFQTIIVMFVTFTLGYVVGNFYFPDAVSPTSSVSNNQQLEVRILD
jgi:serine/threonine protein kinase